MESTCDTTRSRKRCRSRSRKRQDGLELNGARKAEGAWSGRDVHAAGPWPSKSTPGRRTRRAYSCRRFRLTEYVLLFVWNVLRSFHALFVYFTYVSLASSSPRTAPSPFLHFLHFTPGVFFFSLFACVFADASASLLMGSLRCAEGSLTTIDFEVLGFLRVTSRVDIRRGLGKLILDATAVRSCGCAAALAPHWLARQCPSLAPPRNGGC